jgi:hypothetical protein
MGVGTGNTIATSVDGINWIGRGKTIFTTEGLDVAWNGSRFVAVGQGVHSIAYSDNGIDWTGLGTSIFTTQGLCVTWNGTRWVAGGNGGNTLAYSSDGINWTGLGSSIFTSLGRGIGWNGSPINSGEYIELDDYRPGLTDTLDIVGSPYHNQGFTNLSVTITPS